MYVDAEIIIHNGNFFPVKLKSIENQIFINDKQAAISKRTEKVSLKARGNTSVKFEVALDVKALAQIHPELKKQDFCEFKVKGEYAFNALVSTFKVKNTNSQKVNLKNNEDEITRFTIGKDGLKVRNMKTKSSLAGMEISLDLGLQNEHPFDYKINSLDVDITPPDNDSKLGHWRLPSQKIIHAKTLEHMPVKFNISSSKLMSAFSILYSKKVNAVGTCQVVIANEVFNIPIKQSIPLSTNQLVSSPF